MIIQLFCNTNTFVVLPSRLLSTSSPCLLSLSSRLRMPLNRSCRPVAFSSESQFASNPIRNPATTPWLADCTGKPM